MRFLSRSAIVLVALVSSVLIVGTPARAAACGTVLMSGVDWAGGGGVDIKSNGAYQGTGTSCAPGMNQVTTPSGTTVSTGYMWQCVELPNRYYASRGWITSRWTGNGGEMFDTAPGNLTKQANGAITYVNVGDVYVLQGYTFGHVGVVSSVTDNGNGTKTVRIANQNTASVFYNATWNIAAKTLTSIFSGYAVKGLVHAPIAPTDSKILRIKKSTFGSAEQVFAATKTTVFANWWVPGQTGVQTEVAVQGLPAGEQIVDIDKINQPDGVTQSLYTATTAGVRETWWNGSGYSNSALIIQKTGIKRIAVDLKVEDGILTHRVYVLANDGPYEYWWRDGGPVSNGYLLWNINNGIALVKSVALDGADEVYVATAGETYRMKWPVNGGIQRKVVSTLADTVDIAKHAVGSTEYLYTATKTGVHETWWNATSGFSNAAKIVTAPSGYETVSIAKTLTGNYQQLYVAYQGSSTSRTYEYWWGPGSNGIQGANNPLWQFSGNRLVDIEKSTRGSMQYLYSAVGSTVYETWWGNGLFGTGTIRDHAA